MLKAQLQERVRELEAALEAATTRTAEPVREATVFFGVTNLATNQTNWFARENMTRDEAQDYADEHARRVGQRFEVEFYAKAGTERDRV